jgi:DNA-directed RNA polymerase subunit M/transcription elongation factor TFIIS
MKCPNCKKEIKRVMVYSALWPDKIEDKTKITFVECHNCGFDLTNLPEFQKKHRG